MVSVYLPVIRDSAKSLNSHFDIWDDYVQKSMEERAASMVKQILSAKAKAIITQLEKYSDLLSVEELGDKIDRFYTPQMIKEQARFMARNVITDAIILSEDLVNHKSSMPHVPH